MRSSRRKPKYLLGAIMVGLVVASSIGCFEDPISSKLRIEVLPDQQAKVSARTEVSRNLPPENDAARLRAEAMRTALQNQTDPWSLQFRGLDPLEERYVVEWSGGTLTATERSAIVDQSSIEALFRGTAVSAFVTDGDGWTELTIYPGESNRATKEQREELERRMDQWSHVLEEYFLSLDRVIKYLRDKGDRRRPVWRLVFDDLIESEDPEEATEHEVRLAEDLASSIEASLEVFTLSGEQAYSLQEIGYLVYDPFPSEIAIDVPGAVMEHAGFTETPEGYLIERVGLWEAFEGVRGELVTNDPLTAWMASSEAENSFDLDAYLQTPVTLSEAPGAERIIDALETRLRPEQVYRLRWTIRR